MKKWLVSVLLILGGVMVFFSLNNPEKNVEDKPTLTREQQDNIVRRIARNYEIKSIMFVDFDQDGKTGTYLLSIEIDKTTSKQTTLPIRNLETLNDATTSPIGLNPIDRFEDIRRKTRSFDLDISNISIVYLEE